MGRTVRGGNSQWSDCDSCCFSSSLQSKWVDLWGCRCSQLRESLQWHSELYKTGSEKSALKAQGKIWLQSRSVLSVRMAKTSCLVCCHVTSDSHSLRGLRYFTLSFPVHNPILSSLILSCFLFLSPGSELSVWMSCVCVCVECVCLLREKYCVCVCFYVCFSGGWTICWDSWGSMSELKAGFRVWSAPASKDLGGFLLKRQFGGFIILLITATDSLQNK